MMNKRCLDVLSLFTKIPTRLAVEITKSQLDNLKEITSRSVEDICKGLQICLNATNLTFRGKEYKVFGAVMGSFVSTVVANLVMRDVEKRALSAFHSPPRIWEHYIDDTFMIISKNLVEDFLNHLNSIETSI